MGNIRILQPAPISALSAARGSGGANLLTFDPKEVWVDSTVGSGTQFDIDLGSAQILDTIALIAAYGPAAGATWAITGGTSGYSDFTILSSATLRAVDASGLVPANAAALANSHALWTGSAVTARYVRIAVTQPTGNPALQLGRIILGKAFVPTFNNEWGAGRKVIDTGTASRLFGGGFAVVEGARVGGYAFTLGDLSTAEVDQLYALMLDQGETGPVLVVEDPAATTGQRYRIHYGLLTGLRPFERRNPAQTRWEISMEEWI